MERGTISISSTQITFEGREEERRKKSHCHKLISAIYNIYMPGVVWQISHVVGLWSEKVIKIK